MKQIINGKRYDTETAREVGSWGNYGSWRDFSHCEETLYQKRTGEYFLFGEGGPNTKYATRIDSNSWSEGSRIMPMTFGEARQWAEEHLTADEYEAAFGAVAEDDSVVQVGFSLSRTALEMAKRKAAEDGISVSAYIEKLIRG